MLTSLYTGVSGMSANGTALSAIGDNIANLNTVAFKSSRVSFGDVLSQTIGAAQVGRGVMVQSVSPSFSQGSFETTTSALDLAIDGDGFFIVNDGGKNLFTRAGQFTLDKNGSIVSPDGLVLQGYLPDASGAIGGSIGALVIGGKQSPAKMTSEVTVAVNLDSTLTVPSAAFTLDGNGDGTINDPANFNKSTALTVYDSQGDPHDVTAYFVKTAANAWSVHYVYQDPATPSALVDAGSQNLTFGTNGTLINDDSTTALNFDFGASVTTPEPVTFNYGTGTGETPAGTGLDGTTQFASDFAVITLSQNGYSSGFLKNLVISEKGEISGIFTNGQTRAIGKIALAKFPALAGLNKLGRNLYAESVQSGLPIVGTAETSGLGRVLSNTLELSNVDLAQEFVNMISAQRGFQANSKIITTTDELMQEILALKR